MTRELTVRQAGGSLTATLPKEMADRYQIKAGDRLLAVETEDGILITPFEPEFARAMAIYERGARKYRNALRALAK
jgi:antitoxin MazE